MGRNLMRLLNDGERKRADRDQSYDQTEDSAPERLGSRGAGKLGTREVQRGQPYREAVSFNGRFLYLLRPGYHVRHNSYFPSVRKLSQEIKGRLGSLATGCFTSQSDMNGDKELRRNRAI
jgi:hypothetical protein